MLHSISGKLIHTEPNLAVVECGGVGFSCRTTSTSLSSIKEGEDCTFLTYLHVREDALELFGFTTAHELNCFKLLISVSGVGPKVALSILSKMSCQEFALSVVGDDVKALTSVPGIGAKTAQLIILKLKDKLSKEQGIADFASVKSSKASGETIAANSGSEAMSALMVLGFSASEAAGALSNLPEDLQTSEKIKAALKKLSK
ncbi:MAG: Holliday junction branch migration protein RuvA [Oscillospiraceae bacterium]|nr:Holliday junction branch migration protein RuvA [Oscillospiraceae bacterium]